MLSPNADQDIDLHLNCNASYRQTLSQSMPNYLKKSKVHNILIAITYVRMKTIINNSNKVIFAHYDIPPGSSGCITGVGLG